MVTDAGDIFAKIIGNKEDYQINYSKNTTAAKEKQITAISNKGKVEISFIQNSKIVKKEEMDFISPSLLFKISHFL